MELSNFIFNEAQIKSKLLDLNSSKRVQLSDEYFVKSAILFLIIAYKDKPYDLVLIRRTKRDNDKHSGEMGFPGGKYDPEVDKSFIDTAIRECEEELGINRGDIKLLGSFNDHITPKGFIITPIVGYIYENMVMEKQEEEVDEIVKIPITFFADKKNYREKTYTLKGETIAVGKFIYPTATDEQYIIFGATSHIIVHYIQTVHGIILMKPGARRLTCDDIKDRIII